MSIYYYGCKYYPAQLLAREIKYLLNNSGTPNEYCDQRTGLTFKELFEAFIDVKELYDDFLVAVAIDPELLFGKSVFWRRFGETVREFYKKAEPRIQFFFKEAMAEHALGKRSGDISPRNRMSFLETYMELGGSVSLDDLSLHEKYLRRHDFLLLSMRISPENFSSDELLKSIQSDDFDRGSLIIVVWYLSRYLPEPAVDEFLQKLAEAGIEDREDLDFLKGAFSQDNG